MRAGTIVASNYLEMARLLAESFLAQHPDDTFVILLVDDLEVELGAEIDGDERFEIVRLADLSLSDAQLDVMKTIYDVMELSTAVKPSFLELLLRRDEIAVYLDPDIFVYGPFGDLLRAAPSAGIVLTPHVLEPIPRDGTAPDERMIMSSGIFNLGFIGVGRVAAPFLEWWQERLLIDAVSDTEANLFTDQRWVDWVPAIFGCQVCRDPGMNVAWWNIHERDLAADDDGSLTSNGSPLRFVHFSGYDPASPDQLSKHQVNPRTEHSEGSVIRDLADRYGAALEANGHDQRRVTPYQWNTTPTGRPLPAFVRSICRRALLRGERTGTEAGALDTSVPMAFGQHADRFEVWLTEPVSGAEPFRFNRAEVALYESRPDLRAAFPDLDGDGAAAYRNWLQADPSAADLLGDRRLAAPDHVRTESASEAAGPQQGLARRVAGRARREITPYVERARAKVGRDG